jgi:hypothetical protein
MGVEEKDTGSIGTIVMIDPVSFSSTPIKGVTTRNTASLHRINSGGIFVRGRRVS